MVRQSTVMRGEVALVLL